MKGACELIYFQSIGNSRHIETHYYSKIREERSREMPLYSARLNVSTTARALTNNVQNDSWRPWRQSTMAFHLFSRRKLPSWTSTVVLNIIHQCAHCHLPSSLLPSWTLNGGCTCPWRQGGDHGNQATFFEHCHYQNMSSYIVQLYDLLNAP